jgi:hypothetical protein
MPEEYSIQKQDDKTGTVSSYRYSPPSQMPSDKADLLDKIKPELIVEFIKHRLMGEKEVNGKWVLNTNVQTRALKEECVWDITNQILGVANVNTSISKLKDDEIRTRALAKAETIQLMCLKNWKEYGITGTDQLYAIHQVSFDLIFIALKQSQDEGIRNLIKGVRSETASFGDSAVNKKGIIGSLFRK